MFSKKVKVGILAILAVVVLMTNASFGGWVYWTNNDSAGDGQWSTASNWAAGSYPTSGDDVIIYKDTANAAVIGTGVTGYANWLHLCDTSTTGSKVIVNGGTLAVTDHLLIGEEWGTDQKGTLQVDSGTVNTVLLMCGGGRWGNGGNGTLTIDGGNINISWLLAVGGGYAGVSTGMGGHIQIDGGVITLAAGGNAVDQGGLIMSSGGSIDITGGALSLNGVITDITSLANGGSITAYAGEGTFVYDYSVEGRTTITAVIPEPATLILMGLGVLAARRKRA